MLSGKKERDAKMYWKTSTKGDTKIEGHETTRGSCTTTSHSAIHVVVDTIIYLSSLSILKNEMILS